MVNFVSSEGGRPAARRVQGAVRWELHSVGTMNAERLRCMGVNEAM
jgi:hypothetical protein